MYAGGMGGGRGGMGRGREDDEDFMGGRGGMMPGMRGGLMNQGEEIKPTYLTRTDFLIQFVWQPPKPGELNTPEQVQEKIKEMAKQMTDEEVKAKSAVVVTPKEQEIEAVSAKQSQEAINALNKAAGPAAPGAMPTPPATGAPVPK